MLYIYIITTSYHCVNTHYLIQIIFCIPFFKRKFKNTTNHTTYKFLVQIIIKTSIQISIFKHQGTIHFYNQLYSFLSLILALHKTPTKSSKVISHLFSYFSDCIVIAVFSLFCCHIQNTSNIIE